MEIAHITLAEYLDVDFRPDREFIDGEIRERNVGKTEHARVQALLTIWFGNHEKEWDITVGTEWRIRVAKDRVRVPDLAIVSTWPQPDVLVDPPLLVIEILSPDDSYSDTQERAHDYQAMGVATVWIVDPSTRTGRVCSGNEWVETDRLEVKGTPLYVDLPDIFRSLIRT
jgi:Uma2 family endonuclease